MGEIPGQCMPKTSWKEKRVPKFQYDYPYSVWPMFSLELKTAIFFTLFACPHTVSLRLECKVQRARTQFVNIFPVLKQSGTQQVSVYICAHEWMTAGRVCRWKDWSMEGWTEREMVEWTDGWVGKQMGGWMDGWMQITEQREEGEQSGTDTVLLPLALVNTSGSRETATSLINIYLFSISSNTCSNIIQIFVQILFKYLFNIYWIAHYAPGTVLGNTIVLKTDRVSCVFITGYTL